MTTTELAVKQAELMALMGDADLLGMLDSDILNDVKLTKVIPIITLKAGGFEVKIADQVQPMNGSDPRKLSLLMIEVKAGRTFFEPDRKDENGVNIEKPLGKRPICGTGVISITDFKSPKCSGSFTYSGFHALPYGEPPTDIEPSLTEQLSYQCHGCRYSERGSAKAIFGQSSGAPACPDKRVFFVIPIKRLKSMHSYIEEAGMTPAQLTMPAGQQFTEDHFMYRPTNLWVTDRNPLGIGILYVNSTSNWKTLGEIPLMVGSRGYRSEAQLAWRLTCDEVNPPGTTIKYGSLKAEIAGVIDAASLKTLLPKWKEWKPELMTELCRRDVAAATEPDENYSVDEKTGL